MSDWAVPIVYLVMAVGTALSLWWDWNRDQEETRTMLFSLLVWPFILAILWLLYR